MQNLQKLQRPLLTILALASVLLTTNCSRVGPGYVGIKVNQAGTDRGVESYPLKTGWVFYNPITEDVYEYPTYIQSHQFKDESAIQFQSSEGTVLKAPVVISYSMKAESVPKLFVKFRKDADSLSNGYIYQQIKNAFTGAANGFKTIELFTKQGEFMAEVQKHLVTKLGDDFVFDTVSLAGAIEAPDNIKEALDAVIRAQQLAAQADAKVKQAEAEGRQAVATAEAQATVAKAQAEAVLTRAKAEAEANREVSNSISGNLIQLRAVEKWDGAMPQVAGSGATPFINIK